MDLVERSESIRLLHEKLNGLTNGEGHCILVTGEAGIGKTSLIKAFGRDLKDQFDIYTGTCDALFTPSPLAPFFEILTQWGWDLSAKHSFDGNRASLFSSFFQEIGHRSRTPIFIFEDIHWADEATLDLIKFLTRRIHQVHCLLILTFRDDEINKQHRLINVLGQMLTASVSRVPLQRLSRTAVEAMAARKGFNGSEVFSISEGNPFYVTEILSSNTRDIPQNVRDAALAVYNLQDEKTQNAWEMLSAMPGGFELKYTFAAEQGFVQSLESTLSTGVIISRDNRIAFKHELFRRAIESASSPFARILVNQKILDLFASLFERNGEPERIVHHAKNANNAAQIVKFAPIAARKAAALGAHVEAATLLQEAILAETEKTDELLIGLFESYAYECYLTNQVKQAIVYQSKLLALLEKKNDRTQIGNAQRFLSRLWWFDGHHDNAEAYAEKAVNTLKNESPSVAQAMAFSNMSQLKMLADQTPACLHWGRKAIAIAEKLNDMATLSHALNNVGVALMSNPSSLKKGIQMLEQSLTIALEHNFHEHAARAYTNRGSYLVRIKAYGDAEKFLAEGIEYCEERDLDSWIKYMLSWKARCLVETGRWQEARLCAEKLLKDKKQSPITSIGASVVIATIDMRRGDADPLPALMHTKQEAFVTSELQRLVPVMVALLEYEWITGKDVIDKNELTSVIELTKDASDTWGNSELSFWLSLTGRKPLLLSESFAGYQINSSANRRKAVALWETLGCAYVEAICLFEGDETEKKKALSIVEKLGARAVVEKMKRTMRVSGIKSIPRGARKSTESNPAGLTNRELNVLALLSRGLPSKEIASELFISAKTVDHHISSILFKLDTGSRAKAVKKAAELGILGKNF